jgi:hypothetical protein
LGKFWELTSGGDAIYCEAELIPAIGCGRGARRDEHNLLDVLSLTDVPLPLPFTTLTTWRDLCDGVHCETVTNARSQISNCVVIRYLL